MGIYLYLVGAVAVHVSDTDVVVVYTPGVTIVLIGTHREPRQGRAVISQPKDVRVARIRPTKLIEMKKDYY